MKALILHQSILKYDAIGNDIAHMYAILARRFETFVYCYHLDNENLSPIDRNEVQDIIAHKENLLIYHHSVFWEEGEEILARAKAKVVIRYHNITPELFFQPYDKNHFLGCLEGRKQTATICRKYPHFFWMGCSSFNLADAGILDRSNTAVVPPFHNLEMYKNVVPNETSLKSLLESQEINLLFVGRIVPNKNHKFLIEVIHDYVSYYQKDIKLHVVGKRDKALNLYDRELSDYIAMKGMENHVHWVGEVDDSILLAYYLGCDYYLNCSDHEGFCLPIIESQSLCLPVIAKQSSAVKETLGPHQVILDNDVTQYSSAIHVLCENPVYTDYLIEKGLQNYQNRFTNAHIEQRFVQALGEWTGLRI